MANRHYDKLKELENDMLQRMQRVEETLESNEGPEADISPFTSKYSTNLLPKKEAARPLKRILLFALAFVVLGIAVIGATLWLKQSDFVTGVAQKPGHTVRPVLPAPQVTPPQVTPPQATPSQAAAAPQAAPQGDAVPATVADSAPETSAPRPATEQPEPQKKAAPQSAAQPAERQQKRQPPKRVVQQPPQPATPLPGKQPRQAQQTARSTTPHPPEPGSETFFKLKQWLHQAEELRRNGEWDAAIDLYTRIWHEGGNPAVANNLAASLLYRNRLQEAAKVLKAARRIAPDDPDLRANEQLLHQRLQ